MRYFVESYGCTMNQGEGRQLSSHLARLGHVEVSEAGDADLVILNTCTVIETTQNRMLRRLLHLDQEGKKILVTGCMAKVQPLMISESSPGALILPPENYADFTRLINDNFGSSVAVMRPDVGITEILPVAQGCKGVCTYCITKLARGDLRSYPLDSLVAEFNDFLDQGAKEILLSAQDTACYGMDLGIDLPSLLRELLRRPGDYRIRIGMMNPDRVMPILSDLLEVMRDDRVYKFLHLPLQSASDRILSRMGRRYTYNDYRKIVDQARATFPEITIATDIINGFPGEEEEDHLMTMEALRDLQAETVNVTRFSPRPGTAAARFPNRLRSSLSKDRSRETTELRFQVADACNALSMGKVFRVMATEKGKGRSTITRTDSYRPVIVQGEFSLGAVMTVKVVGHAPTHLFGELLSPQS